LTATSGDPRGRKAAGRGCLRLGEADEDDLSSQISKKFGRYRRQVGFAIDDAAPQRVLLARLTDLQDSTGFSACAFDLHVTILVDRGNNGRSTIL
jgi:hypothetical protein